MVTTSYSLMGFHQGDQAAAIAGTAEAGFTTVEVCACAPHMSDAPQASEAPAVRQMLDAAGIAATSVHAPMGRVTPGAPEEDWRAEMSAVLAEVIRFSGAIGAKGMVIHPIPNPMFVDDPANPDTLAALEPALRRSLDELVPVAAESNIRILLENLPYGKDYPLTNMGALRKVVEQYPDPQLGLVVDVGHSWTNRMDPVEDIRNAGDRLHGTHLQDVDADDPQDQHWLPGEGGLKWDAIREALQQAGYSDVWTFEVINPRQGEDALALAKRTRELATTWGL